MYIYNTRKYGFLSFKNFLNEISQIKNLERRIAVNKWNKYERFRKKQHEIEDKVPQDFIGNKQKKSFFYEPREGGKMG